MLGIVKLSVCSLHQEEAFSSQMLTQGLLGTPLIVVGGDKWYKVRLEDGYEGYAHPAAVQGVCQQQYNEWVSCPKIVVTAHYGFAYEKPDCASQCISDIVSGCQFKYINELDLFFEVAYPNGRRAFIPKALSEREDVWRKGLKPDAAHILKAAFSLYGIPYLWGGTSAKGVDCSGFVKLCFLLNGLKIPRDAYQQALCGELVEALPDFSNLLPGDLLFFGSKAVDEVAEQIKHVGIYVSDGRYIHSQGDVHVNSLYVRHGNYHLENRKSLLFVKRICYG